MYLINHRNIKKSSTLVYQLILHTYLGNRMYKFCSDMEDIPTIQTKKKRLLQKYLVPFAHMSHTSLMQKKNVVVTKCLKKTVYMIEIVNLWV